MHKGTALWGLYSGDLMWGSYHREAPVWVNKTYALIPLALADVDASMWKQI